MKLGINTISIMRQLREDFEGTANILKEGGCTYFEPFGDWGAGKEQLLRCERRGGKSGWDRENMIRRLEYMRSVNMDIYGMFVFSEILDEQAEELGQYFQKYGIRYVVVNVGKLKDLDEVYAHIAMLKRAAKKLQQYHVQIVKHNHEFELERVIDRDGKEKYVLDIFLEQCSKEELMLEVDTGWVVYAGLDLRQFIEENIERIYSVHLKDISKDYKLKPRDYISVACGQGIVNFRDAFTAVPEELRDRILWLLDQDTSEGDIIQDQLLSMEYLNQLEKEMWKGKIL